MFGKSSDRQIEEAFYQHFDEFPTGSLADLLVR